MTLFDANVAALTKRYPNITMESIRSYPVREDLQLLDTPTGDPTAKIGGQLLHSQRDPRREAVRLFDGATQQPKLLILEGNALGYHAEEYLKSFADGELWVIEPDIPLFLWVCSVRDLTGVISSSRVTLFLGAPATSISYALASTEGTDVRVAKIRSVYQKDLDYYNEVERSIDNLLSRRRVNRNTLKKFGALWVRNLFRNLPILQRAAGVWRLEGFFEGVPVLLLAAGPSLGEILPVLGRLRERMVVVAVDTAVFSINEAGITPDLLVVVDPQYLNSRHLDGVETSGTIVIGYSSTHPRAFRREYSGCFLGNSPFPLGKTIEKGTDVRGGLGSGGSVATTAWELSRVMGATAIYCGGLDLGFPGGHTHHRSSLFERWMLHSATRLNPMECMDYRYLNEGNPVLLPSNSGGQVLSNQRMEIYARWFEEWVGQPGVPPTFNLSRNGVAMQKFPYQEVSELLELPIVREDIAARMANLIHSSPPSPGEEFHASLASLSRDLGRMLELAEGGIKQIATMADHSSPMTTERGLVELNRIDSELLAIPSRNVAGFLFQELLDEFNQLDPALDLATPLERSRRLYQEIASSSKYHLELLEGSLGALQPPGG